MTPPTALIAAVDVGLGAWLAFGALVLVLLAIDLAVFHRRTQASTFRQSAIWTAVWCLIALAFNGFIWFWRGGAVGLQFLTGYLLEWSLSMDNVFVFAVLFNYFQVPLKYQHRVLFWGILGAIVMRLSFILVGATLLHHFHWIMPLFGILLVYQGVHLALQGEADLEPEKTLVMKFARRMLPIAKGDYGSRFFVVENGRRMITSLFLVLLIIEWTDVVFAVDSVPAIFGVTDDTFTIFTSNIFAILGLRALYFLLAASMDLFRFLKYGLSGVLIFIGAKMILDFWFPDKIPQWAALAVVGTLLAVSIAASLLVKKPPIVQDTPPSEQ